MPRNAHMFPVSFGGRYRSKHTLLNPLQLLQAPAGVLLWRGRLLVSCCVTINRTESVFFLQEAMLQEGASLSASANTHTLTHWSFCRLLQSYMCVYARLCFCDTYPRVQPRVSPLCRVGFSFIWAVAFTCLSAKQRIPPVCQPACLRTRSHALLSFQPV